MGALSAGPGLVAVLGLAALGAGCSPEAERTRDGGMGADPGNKVLVEARRVEPRAADTTLWPGRAPAPVERFARGQVPPATFPARRETPAERGQTAVTPDTPPTQSQQRTFDSDPSVTPREPSGGER
ncbi:MAG TPA: hypothetical protein VHG35_06865 [Gemmatimonadales bacterium]|nr:hypothetical protein [Gemmatimonadales bacterium]